jgi:hypothetical protein
MALEVFDLDNMTLSFAAIPLTGGFGEGGSVSIRKNENMFDYKVGRSGNVVRYKNNDRTATVEITLMQTSTLNSQLNAIAQLDMNASNGAGVGVFECKDNTNGDTYFAASAWLQSPPEVELGMEVTDRMWTILCERLEFAPGG